MPGMASGVTELSYAVRVSHCHNQVTGTVTSPDVQAESGFPCVVALDLSSGMEDPEAAFCLSAFDDQDTPSKQNYICLTEQNT